MALLSVQDLCVEFATADGPLRAVDGASFDVAPGEVMGLVGESGSGKTVACRSVLRLLPGRNARIASGRVLLEGRDLVPLSEAAMREIRGPQIAMIFQNPSTHLDPVMTIGEQVGEAIIYHEGASRAEARRRAAALLRGVGIPDAERQLDAYAHQFSGGMRQRVMIAAALACRPKLLIADEPTTALDVTIQAQIVELVKRLQEVLGMAVMWITHDLGIVAGLAKQVNVMYAGYIIERGFVRDIYARPRHPYTMGLLGSLPRLDESPGTKLLSIPGLPPDLIELPPGCPFAARCTYAVSECLEKMPPLEEADSEGHTVACWRWTHVAGKGN